MINSTNYKLESNIHADDVFWYPVNDIGLISKENISLAFDHEKIINYGVDRLRNKIKYTPIGFGLLSQYFTLSELHNLYETILNKKIDRRNFAKKMNSSGLIEKTNFKNIGSIGRNAQLYCFNEIKYMELEKKGINFEF